MQVSDKSIVCRTCSNSFLCTAKEQEFFIQKGFSEPKVCRECRNQRRTKIENRSSNCLNGIGLGLQVNLSLADNGNKSAQPTESSKGEKRRIDGEDNKITPERTSDTTQDSKRIRSDSTRDSFTAQRETDRVRIEQRLKQIQYGYNSAAYDNYAATVPKNARVFGDDNHPRTPDAYAVQSKRAFEGRVKKWRRDLHKWDLTGSTEKHDEFGTEAEEAFSSELDSGAHTLTSASSMKLKAEHHSPMMANAHTGMAAEGFEMKSENILAVAGAGSESDDEDDVL